MTPTQTVAFVAACRAANPGWNPVDGTAELWHASTLQNVDADHARAALMRLVAENAPWWPNPADVARVARQVRAEQAPAEITGGSFSRSCPFRGCQCTHTDGCVRGWLEGDDGAAVPCPVCRWNRVRQSGESRAAWMERLRSQDSAWARESA